MKKALYNKSFRHLLLLLTLISGALALAPTADATGVFDTFQNSFQALSQSWFGKAQGYANDIFYIFLMADFTWLTLTWLISRKTFDEILPSMIRKVMVYGFFLMLIVNAGTFLPTIVNGFQQMGTGIGGVPTMTPSTLVSTGNSLAYGILTGDYSGVQKYVPGATVPAPAVAGGTATSGATCNWYTLCLNKAAAAVSDSIAFGLAKLEFFLLSLLFAGITWVAFLLIAVDLLITLIEAYVVLGVGVVFLGFGASRWTTKFADGILNYSVSVGVKLMMLYLVIGALLTAVVPTVVNQMMVTASSGTGALTSLLAGGAGVVLMLMLSKSIPSKAQSLLSGAAALGAAHAIQETAGPAGVARQGAAATAGVAALATGGFKKAAAVVSRAAGGSVSGGSGGSGGDAPASGAPAPSGGLMANAGKAAGAAISAAGTAVGAGIQAAGKVAGKGTEMAGKAASQGASAAKSAASQAASGAGVGTGVQSTESTATKAPPLQPKQETARAQRGSSSVSNAARAAGMVTRHPGGSVQAGHVSTSHGND